MIQISVAGGMLDVPQQEVNRSFSTMRFSDAIPSQFTTDIELPRTAHNVALLGAYGELDRGQLFGEKIPCFIASDLLNVQGCLTVDRLTADTITCTVFFGTLPTEMLDVKIRDLIGDDSYTTLDMVSYANGHDSSERSVGKYNFYDSGLALRSGYSLNVPPYDDYGVPIMPAIKVDYLLQLIGAKIGCTMPFFGRKWYIVAKQLVGTRNVPAVSVYGITGDNLHQGVFDDTPKSECPQTGITITQTGYDISVKTDQDCTVEILIGGIIQEIYDYPYPLLPLIHITGHGEGYIDYVGGVYNNGVSYQFAATAGQTYTWHIFANIYVAKAVLAVKARTIGQQIGEEDEHEPIDVKILGRYGEHNLCYPNVSDCYIGTIACLGDLSVKDLLTALCWQTGQRLIMDGNTLSLRPATLTKTLRNATMVAFEPVFDQLGRHTLLKRTDGQRWDYVIENSLLADEMVLQDIPVYSDGMTTPRAAQQPRRRLVAPVYEFEWNTEEQQWDISAGDIDGIIIGELDTTNWWLQPLGAPSWLGVDHLGKVALTTWQTYEDVSECDYVYIFGHQYMLVDGTVDEESGLCEFRALEVAQPVTTQGRDFSDDFSDDFS